MLDIFGNVFGKSKKNTNQQQPNDQTEEGTANENESYVFVNHNNSATYPQTTILTDELIRMGSSSSVQQPGHSQASTSGQAGSFVYPSLDVTNGFNPSLPFSSTGSNHNSLAAPVPFSSHGSSSNLTRNASPIDNVPFALTAANLGGSSGGRSIDDDAEISETINRIRQFVSNPSQSVYNFQLENSILRESFLT